MDIFDRIPEHWSVGGGSLSKIYTRQDFIPREKKQVMTHTEAITYWTEYQRRISVGAYEERSSYHHETDTWPADGIEESVFNLENWAARQGLEFCWNHDTKTWSLEPIAHD